MCCDRVEVPQQCVSLCCQHCVGDLGCAVYVLCIDVYKRLLGCLDQPLGKDLTGTTLGWCAACVLLCWLVDVLLWSCCSSTHVCRSVTVMHLMLMPSKFWSSLSTHAIVHRLSDRSCCLLLQLYLSSLDTLQPNAEHNVETVHKCTGATGNQGINLQTATNCPTIPAVLLRVSVLAAGCPGPHRTGVQQCRCPAQPAASAAAAAPPAPRSRCLRPHPAPCSGAARPVCWASCPAALS